jgi:hypothetical protein
MHASNVVKLLLMAFCAALLVGCAASSAPRGWLSNADKSQGESYGAWISLEYLWGETKTKIRGEFIAVDNDTVFVFTDNKLSGYPVSQIKKAKLTTYNSQHGQLALWTLLGSLSAVSHGLAGIISIPVWILSGTFATAGQSYAPIKRFPQKSWNDLSKFARFPQGIPPDLDRAKLNEKPRS